MATSITYGSYSFPEPIPLVAEEDNAIVIAGQYDHSAIRVNLVGYLTGSDLSGLDLQKMQMISGFLNEYQDLTITVENESKVCSKSYVESISFQDSDVTTFMPYSLSLLYYSGETFSDYFNVTEPQDTWEYTEEDGKKVIATHTVSAKGLTIGSSSELENARSFVTSRLANGFQSLGLFNSATSEAYLTSRSENLDRKSNTYGVTETYIYSTSEDYADGEIFDSISGIVDVATDINFELDQGLSVSVRGSVQGNIDANTGSIGNLSTGDFTPAQATEIALNAIVNSYSDYESGVYSFISNGPTSFSYDLDTGANLLNFSFDFADSDNLYLIDGNVIHKYSTSINISKDSPVAQISVQGNLSYNGSAFISATGQFEDNPRFKALTGAFASVDPFLIAREAIDDFTGVATGYEFSSSYLNTGATDFSITKNPVENTINYSYNYNNQFDFSSGRLTDFSINITDQKPLQLSSVQETITGVTATNIISRSLGVYSVSAQSNDGPDELETLKEIVSGFCSGDHVISSSYVTGQNRISYNLSRYY